MARGFISQTILLTTIFLCLVASTRAEEFESISSRVSAGYHRKRNSDGTFQPESYVFARGGYWSGPLFDGSIDKLDFVDIARALAVPLAHQNYLPTADQKATNLLLLVYWGTTFAPENASESNAYIIAQKKASQEHESFHALQDAEQASGQSQSQGGVGEAEVRQAKLINAQDGDALSASLGVVQSENQFRDLANMRNAQMLGYDSEWNQIMGGLVGPTQDMRKASMIAELEEDRYFVVIMAYDYQLLVKQKKHQLLWETRYSIRQHSHAFDGQLMAMTVQASRFFGQDSGGLTRAPLPTGNVEIGPMKNLGEAQSTARDTNSPRGK